MIMDWYITTGYPIVLTAVMGYIVWYLQNRDKKAKQELDKVEEQRKANHQGTRCILRRQLIEDHEKYVPRGWITPHGYENVKDELEAYEALGGNGKVKKMSLETLALPIREKEVVNPRMEEN